MTMQNKDLEYMIELHSRLNGSYSTFENRGGLIGRGGRGMVTSQPVRNSYFKKSEIDEETADRILKDIKSHDLIIYPFMQRITTAVPGPRKIDQAIALIAPKLTVSKVKGYEILQTEQQYPSMPVETRVLLRLANDHLPKGYRPKFKYLAERKRNQDLMNLLIPDKLEQISQYAK